MATFLFLASVIFVCFSLPQYALVAAVCCVAFVLDELVKEMKRRNRDVE